MINAREIEAIGARMNAQDNLATQWPIFAIQITKEQITHEDFADYYIQVDGEGNKMEEDDLCEDCQMEDELSDDCVTCGFRRKLPVKEERTFDLRAGVFFTAAACQEHIKQNKHHYEGMDARPYAISAWRNPEMQTVMHMLSIFGSPVEEAAGFYR